MKAMSIIKLHGSFCTQLCGNCLFSGVYGVVSFRVGEIFEIKIARQFESPDPSHQNGRDICNKYRCTFTEIKNKSRCTRWVN